MFTFLLDGMEKPKVLFHFNTAMVGYWEIKWWDIGKLKIEKLCNQYTSNVTRDTLQNIRNLEMDILELQGLCGAHREPGQIQTLKDKKVALSDLLDIRVHWL